MMQGRIRFLLGVTSRAVSHRRILAACIRVAPNALNARTRDTLIRTSRVPYFAQILRVQGRFDQNEKKFSRLWLHSCLLSIVVPDSFVEQ